MWTRRAVAVLGAPSLASAWLQTSSAGACTGGAGRQNQYLVLAVLTVGRPVFPCRLPAHESPRTVEDSPRVSSVHEHNTATRMLRGVGKHSWRRAAGSTPSVWCSPRHALLNSLRNRNAQELARHVWPQHRGNGARPLGVPRGERHGHPPRLALLVFRHRALGWRTPQRRG